MFSWLNDIIGGLSDAMANSFQSIGESISNNIMNKMLEWIYTCIYDAIAQFFTMISGMGAEIFELSWVNSTVKLFSLLGWALFGVGLVVSIFDLAIESQSGRSNIKGTALNFIKGFMAVNLFSLVPIELYKFCISMQNTFAGDLTRVFVGEQNVDIGAVALKVLTSNLSTEVATVSLFSLIALIALGYCVIKIFFANIKRGGILLIQIAVGSLHMFSVPRGHNEGFYMWCKQIIALCLTAFLQTTLLFLGLLTWQDHMLLAIGIMLSANEVPRIAEQFGLDTSASINNAIQTAYTAVNVTKTISTAMH